jgi:hypothetical protein
MENAMMEVVEGDAVMETDDDATTAVEAGAVRPPDGIDALPYADKDFDVPGSRDAVRECPSSHALNCSLPSPFPPPPPPSTH